jgi:CheY-like chemotaxis protein
MSTWMIVEDEPDLYDMLLIMTEALAHEGVAFLNGEEAVHWIDDVDFKRIKAQRPDFALIDVRLPGKIQGDQVSARLRQSAVMAGIPVIIMTAYRLSSDEEKALVRRAGADALLYKPLPSPQQLQDLFRKLSESATA